MPVMNMPENEFEASVMFKYQCHDIGSKVILWYNCVNCFQIVRHCEKRSDEAIQKNIGFRHFWIASLRSQ
jgi:hypothetical protein